jgi:Phosphorylated CTD interacting factor 1 WW domain
MKRSNTHNKQLNRKRKSQGIHSRKPNSNSRSVSSSTAQTSTRSGFTDSDSADSKKDAFRTIAMSNRRKAKTVSAASDFALDFHITGTSGNQSIDPLTALLQSHTGADETSNSSSNVRNASRNNRSDSDDFDRSHSRKRSKVATHDTDDTQVSGIAAFHTGPSSLDALLAQMQPAVPSGDDDDDDDKEHAIAARKASAEASASWKRILVHRSDAKTDHDVTGMLVGDSNKTIWNPLVCIPRDYIRHAMMRKCAASSSIAVIWDTKTQLSKRTSWEPSPAVEQARSRAVHGLRSLLQGRIDALQVELPNDAFEQWLICRKLAEAERDDMVASSDTKSMSDPVIPFRPLHDPGLYEQLTKAGVSSRDAAGILDSLARTATKSVQQLWRMQQSAALLSSAAGNKRSGKRSVSVAQKELKVKPKKKRFSNGKGGAAAEEPDPNAKPEMRTVYEFRFGKSTLMLNVVHYDKLKRMYERECLPASATPRTFWSSTRHMQLFHERVYVLLLRYAIVQGAFTQGAGLHAALPGACFDALFQHLNVRMECFASPLNSRYARFCTAFPDTDVFFGGCGSFFDFAPEYGFFQSNPPFISEVISSMASRMTELLTDSQQPLGFLVIVPAWTDTRAWRELDSHPFKRYHFIVDQRDHAFCEGAQHLRKSRQRVSTCDTSVFVLQNASAAKIWPVTKVLENHIRRAFVRKRPNQR